MPYSELHCHTNFSFLDGASHPEAMVERAVELGYRALAITDHDGFYGVSRFWQAASAVGQCLPPYGMEPLVWNRIQTEASAIVTTLEKGEDGDDDEAVTSAARALRDFLRNYV